MQPQSPFIGRDADLAILRRAYREAASGTPRVVAIIAESGFGRTRLAQEFYNWLSIAHDGVGGEGYWPDRLSRAADNLRVNPDPGDCGGDGKRMPFLWWGLRLADSEQENSVTGKALRIGVEVLRAHLGDYKYNFVISKLNKEQSSKKSIILRSFNFSLLKTGLEHVGKFTTGGFFDINKDILEIYRNRKSSQQKINDLKDRKINLAALKKGNNDKLSEDTLDDLYTLCKAPPDGFQPIPLVILVDDVQWLDRDAGMSAFLDTLLNRARAENWPLLVLLTGRRAQWRAAEDAGRSPANLVAAPGDIVHALAGVAGLEEIIRAALPGLTEAQSHELTRKADGSPRLLDEMIRFMSGNPDLFVERDLARPLTEAGFEEILALDYRALVARRLRDAPDPVRRALSLASIQGMRFSPRLVQHVAEGLGLVDAAAGLKQGGDPHGFISAGSARQAGEFRLPVYQQAARDILANALEADSVEARLRAALADIAGDPASATEYELGLILDNRELFGREWLGEGWAGHAIDAGEQLISHALASSDTRTAAEVSKKILPLLTDDILCEKREAALWACHAAVEGGRLDRDVQRVLHALSEALRVRVKEQPTPDARRDLAHARGILATAVNDLDGPAAARSLYEEATSLMRAVVEERPTPDARHDLAATLTSRAITVAALDGPAAARPLYEEAAGLWRTAAEDQPARPVARGDLARTLMNFANAVNDLDGPAAAQPLYAEAASLWRAAVEERPTPGTRHRLAGTLTNLANAVNDLDGPAAARSLYAEAVSLWRALVEDQPAPNARHSLAAMLVKLAIAVTALDGPAAARPLYEEAASLMRTVVEDQPTPGARHGLASVLMDLATAVNDLDGPAATRPLYEEAASLRRAVVEELQTPDARHGLTATLMKLANAVNNLDGPAAARPLYEEAVVIFRPIARQMPEPGNRNTFVFILKQLLASAESLNDDAAARSLKAEIEELQVLPEQTRSQVV